MTQKQPEGMTAEQMMARSREKVQKISELMNLLQVRVEARQHVNMQTGFIEMMVFWTDDEKYPAAPVETRAPEGDQPAQEEPKAEEAGNPEAEAKVETDGEGTPAVM